MINGGLMRLPAACDFIPPRASQIDRRTKPPPAVSTHVINAAHSITSLLVRVVVLYPKILQIEPTSRTTGGSFREVDRLDALGDPELRNTVLLVRSSAKPVTADDVATRLDVSRSVARWRLE